MIAIDNIDNIEAILRSELIAQSELMPKFVRNALSLYGEALDKFLSEQTFVSIDTKDALILFELQSRDNDSDMSESEDSSLAYYKSFRIYVIIYGDNSTNVANRIVARFRTQNVRDRLHSQGIHLETISDPKRINEYKNETMWIRNDISIDISCQIEVKQTSQEDEMSDLPSSGITIIKGE